MIRVHRSSKEEDCMGTDIDRLAVSCGNGSSGNSFLIVTFLCEIESNVSS